MDEILNKFGLTYEDLNKSEKEQLEIWMNALQTNQLTTDKIKEHLSAMRFSVEQELVNEPETRFIFFINRKQILLKARLRNYMLLEAFLSSPERAKAAIEQSISQLKQTKG